jgi:hypothetical protein
VIVPLADQRLLVAHRGHLAVIHEGEDRPRIHDVGEGSLVRLVAGSNGFFAVKHHSFSEPPVRVLTAHHVSAPELPVARLAIDDDWSVSGSGDPAAWDQLPRLYDLVYPYLLQLESGAARILQLPGIPGEPETPDDPYRTIPCPDSETAIVAQTRRGRFVVYNVGDGAVVADVSLGIGPPIFRFHPVTGLPWMARHDTIVRFDAAWQPVQMARIRESVRGAVISDMTFHPSGSATAVAYSERRPVPMIQPYRLAPVDGGVMLIDAEAMEVVSGAATDRWVDDIAFTTGSRLALRERDGDIEVRFIEPGPVDARLHPPRPKGEEWI